ncbi:recombinase family protein [Corynebacterium halotolerans]|uniref:recombinase family protein n=1 Tax=Corynebacterium halotolerans TaxID=225326 RepID=UPI003CF09AE9
MGTLLGTGGRPEGRVQIIRKGKKATRIRRSVNYGRSWAAEDEQVDTGLILDDGGRLWEQHTTNPKHATYLSITGEPAGRLSVQRVYKHVVKARLYHGDSQWSELQDFHPGDVRFDGGASAGWHPPAWHEDAKDTSDAGGEGTDGSQDTGTATVSAVTDQQKNSGANRGQRVSYIRVSTAEQNLARQREMIGAVDHEFQDKISARSRADRAGLEDCIGYLREHDQLVVASIDRLARSLADLQGLIDQITDKGASVHFIKENLTFSAESSDPRVRLMLGILGSFAEFERSIIRERQAEGISLAKKAGKYTGRKRALTPDKVEEAKQRAKAGESKVAIAKDLGVSRATLYRALTEKNQQSSN